MNNFKKILTIIRRPFQQEFRKGCQDDVVVNGLGAYVALWVEQGNTLPLTPNEKQVLTWLAARFENYAGLSPAERQQTLQVATEQIEAVLLGTSSNQSVDIKHKKSTYTPSKQVENLPLFRETEASQETVVPPKLTQTSDSRRAMDKKSTFAYAKQVENLPLFRETEAIQKTTLPSKPPSAADSRRSKVAGTVPVLSAAEDTRGADETSVPIGDTPVSTDVESLEFLKKPLQYLKGIGPRRAAMLVTELDIRTVGELLEYYPRDYIDRSKTVEIYSVGRAMDGESETIQGKVVNHTASLTAKGKRIGKVSIYDGTGVAVLVNFGRRIGYIKSILLVGTEVVVNGKFTRRYNEIQTTDYEFELFDEENLIHTKRIVPKYALTAKLTARMLRAWVRTALDAHGDEIPEILPHPFRQRQQLIDRRQAFNEIHFPKSEAHRKSAQKRLAFDEFFLLSLGMELRKDTRASQNGIQFQMKDGRMEGRKGGKVEGWKDGRAEECRDRSSLLQQFVDSLPFALTGAQKRVFSEIRADMQSNRVMNRLIQGDVGSGKTVVAAMALLCAIQSGYQGALMVPTEILAEQHYHNLSALFTPFDVKVVLLKSDLPKSEREAALTAITDGTANLIVGTQALIQEGVDFHKLGLVIIDEQHRFGVMQRATLRHKGQTPDVLVMTATPIPRTLSLTIYGDLNVSVIDEMPPGRQKIETRWVKENDRQQLYVKLEREVRRGKQAYIVYPLVEESEKLEELKAATNMAEHFQHDIFPHLRVGLLHGQMKSAEKQEIMLQFNARQIDILVATTVIEVGIDVPNATLMVIENAERFGLAQLHQLRGRVGRGSDKSACYLVATPRTDDAYRRIQVMVRSNNGFEIAEEDLNIRGPGEFFGTRQSGIPNFKIANILSDVSLLEAAKKEAGQLVKADPKLNAPEHQLLKRMLQTHWKGQLEIASVG